jgi:putative PD-(D/E)XK family protein DUF4420
LSADEFSQLERAWAVLVPPTASDASELSSFPLDVAFGALECRVALDGTGSRHLLVPAVGETVVADSRPSTLNQAVRKLIFGRQEAVYIDISCVDLDLYPEFDDVVTDVLEAVQDSDKPGEVALHTVARWRRLFRSRLVHGLNAQAKLGLFAELTVLSALLDSDPGFEVASWRGPLREPHDFEAPRRCIEVKALGTESKAVVIHGLDQLDQHDERPLDLALVTVVSDPEGTTIAELVEQIQERTDSVPDFRSRLKAAGWSNDPARPETDSYSVAEVLRVNVGLATPRLVSSSLVTGTLSDGVGDLSYCIELAALLPLVDGSSLAELAEEGVR